MEIRDFILSKDPSTTNNFFVRDFKCNKAYCNLFGLHDFLSKGYNFTTILALLSELFMLG